MPKASCPRSHGRSDSGPATVLRPRFRGRFPCEPLEQLLHPGAPERLLRHRGRQRELPRLCDEQLARREPRRPVERHGNVLPRVWPDGSPGHAFPLSDHHGAAAAHRAQSRGRREVGASLRTFQDGQAVRFDDLGSAMSPVRLEGPLQPVTVNGGGAIRPRWRCGRIDSGRCGDDGRRLAVGAGTRFNQ